MCVCVCGVCVCVCVCVCVVLAGWRTEGQEGEKGIGGPAFVVNGQSV